MTRCSYCATYTGHLRCDNCGAPKAPATLTNEPGRRLTFTAPLAYSDLVIEGRFYSMHPDHMPATLRAFLEARERYPSAMSGLLHDSLGIKP